MSAQELQSTAAALVAQGRGILAADESTGTVGKRLASIGVENTEANRQAYRQLLFTSPEVESHISGVIMYDETIRQSTDSGVSFGELLAAKGVMPGIKVDTGAKPLAGAPGELVTEGLDGLRGRLEEYRGLGARFAKWRAVITITEGLPSLRCMEANAHALARYAALCQEAGIVPIVEPEVLMSGAHTIDRCEAVTRDTHRLVFAQLARCGVRFDGMLLKPNMVISGQECEAQASVQEVAARTVALLRDTVPASVPGIVFLSGGQSETLATEHLQAMNEGAPSLPWALSFSYGRALQHSALRAWAGKSSNVGVASKTLLHRARCNAHAARGEYTSSME